MMFPKRTQSKPPQHTPPEEIGWVPLKVAVTYFGISGQAFHQGVRQWMDVAHIRDAGKRGAVKVWMPGAIAAYKDHAVEMTKTAKGDPLLSGGGPSPALERYRAAKAIQEEMNVELRRRSHLDANEISGELKRFAGVMRHAIEQVQREYGNDPAEILNEAIRETAAGWQSVIHPNPEKETRDNDTAPAPIHAVDADRVLPPASARPKKRSREVQRRTASETKDTKSHKAN